MPYASLSKGQTEQYKKQEQLKQTKYAKALDPTQATKFAFPDFPYRLGAIHAAQSNLKADDINAKKIQISNALAALKAKEPEKIAKLLGKSLIPARTHYYQKTLQSLYDWMNLQIEYLVYERAKYLFYYFMKDFSYRALLQFAACLNTENLANYQNRYAELIAFASPTGSISFDLYAAALHSPDYHDLYHFLTQLESKNSLAIHAVKQRQLSKQDAKVLLKLFETDLALLQSSTFIKNKQTIIQTIALNTNRINLMIEEENDGLGSHLYSDSAVKYNATLKNTLTRFQEMLNSSTDRERQLLLKIKRLIKKGKDVLLIDVFLKTQMQSLINSANHILNHQQKSYARFIESVSYFRTIEVNPAIANIALNEKKLYLEDEDGICNPLLHIVFKEYDNATVKGEKEKLLRCIYQLISRGYSPFCRNSDGQTAFEYADMECHWNIMAQALRFTITVSDPAETIRLHLLDYCVRSAKQISSWKWRFFHSLETKQTRFAFVAELTELIADASLRHDALSRKIVAIIQNNQIALNKSSLNTTINRICKEIERYALTPKVKANDVPLPEMIPQRHSLFKKNKGYFVLPSTGNARRLTI